eukprot:gene4960-6177_t
MLTTPTTYDVYDSILGTLPYIRTPKNFYVLTLRSGIKYTGINNKNIDIKGLNLFFTSTSNEPAVIDCSANSRAFNITGNSEITFYNIIFNNCSNSEGGTILVSDNSRLFLEKVTINGSSSDFGALTLRSNSKAFITNSKFSHNTAYEDGTAINVRDNSKVEIDSTTQFVGNKRIVMLNQKQHRLSNDISVAKDSLVLLQVDDFQNVTIYSTCDSTSSFINNHGLSLCSRLIAEPSSLPATCGDNICDPIKEDSFNCPQDCNQTFTNGFLHQQFDCSIDGLNCVRTLIEPVTSPDLKLYENRDIFNGTLHGQLDTYFHISNDGNFYLQFSISNIKLYVYLDNSPVLQFDGSQESLLFGDEYLTTSKYLVADNVHKLTVKYEATSTSMFGPRYLNLKYSLTGEPNTYTLFKGINFYSNNTCGDGVYDHGETCKADLNGYGSPVTLPNVHVNSSKLCGNGICDEVDPNSCIYDCYKYITPKCPHNQLKKGSLAPLDTGDDTLGKLIWNQIDWRLPGYQHFTFGYDIVFGQQRSFPIFYFGFCDDEPSIIEDSYRQTFYNVPKELSVVPLPKCAFEVKSEFHSSAAKMKQDMQFKSKKSVQGSVNAGIGPISAEVSASYSREKSVKSAMEMETKLKGTVIKSSIECSSFSVSLNSNRFQFSLNFLRDISNAQTVDNFYNLIKIYGTHYYDSATLGGNLEQVTIINESEIKAERKREIEEQTTKSMSAKVSSPKFSVQSTYRDSNSNKTNEESMQSYHDKTTKSTITTKGGAPGSYGPSPSSESNNFGEWASTIDLYPIPINIKTVRIAEIIPKSWKTLSGEYVSSLWESAEYRYYTTMGQEFQSFLTTSKEKTNLLWISGAGDRNSIFNGPLSLAIETKVKNLTSSVDLRAVPSTSGSYDSLNFPAMDNLGFYPRLEYVVISPPFNVTWVPSEYNQVKLVSNLYDKSTRVKSTTSVDGKTTNITHIENMMFVNTGQTSELPINYLWDASSDKRSTSKRSTPIWEPYYFDNEGILKKPENLGIGYLLIPAMPFEYNGIAINIHTGGYVTVLYVNYKVKAKTRQLIGIPQEHLAKILVATSIDYTPEYTFFQGLGADYDWYKPNQPSSSNWYWDKSQSMEGLFGRIRDWKWGGTNDYCAAAINYDRSCYIQDCRAKREVAKITSIYIPTSDYSYFFLPNQKGEYISISISGTNTVCGDYGYYNAHGGERQYYYHEYGVTETLDNWSVGRLHNLDTFAQVQNQDRDPKDFDETWWASVILPARNWFPEILPSNYNNDYNLPFN